MHDDIKNILGVVGVCVMVGLVAYSKYGVTVSKENLRKAQNELRITCAERGPSTGAVDSAIVRYATKGESKEIVDSLLNAIPHDICDSILLQRSLIK